MASRAPVDQNFLSDLVERRIEVPEVEYKNFMPLAENAERAKIARHICALANYGGGWLVFGFEDDGTPTEPHAASLDAYQQDAINGIAERYLVPQPHCEAHFVRATSGRIYPVLRVPSHGTVPICSKADGPQDLKGAPQGIRKGVHYIREPGPKSVPIDSPERWQDLLRRCVLAERAGLIKSIGQLFDRPDTLPVEGSDIQGLLDRAGESWITFKEPEWPVDLASNRVIFAFRLLTEDGVAPVALPLARLEQAIRSASSAGGDLLGESGGPFDPGWGLEDRAKVALIEGHDAYALRRGSPPGTYNLPMDWYVRDDGMGVEGTGIPEDNPWVRGAVEDRGGNRVWPSGRRLAPSFQIDTIAQRIVFVARFAESFPDAVRCELAVDFRGLNGRELSEPAAGVYFSTRRSSSVDARRVPLTVGVAALTANLAEITADLIGPIFRLFDAWTIDADYVRGRLAKR